MTILWIIFLAYFTIGVLLTAFCVHMSYHEAAVGFGDADDAKAQKVIESKTGLLWVLFLFTCWPLAIYLAMRNYPSPDAVIHPNKAGDIHAKA